MKTEVPTLSSLDIKVRWSKHWRTVPSGPSERTVGLREVAWDESEVRSDFRVEEEHGTLFP